MSNQTNGVATPKPTANGSQKADIKKEAPVINLGKLEPGDLPPLDARLRRLDELQVLQQRYVKLNESLAKLKSFKVKGSEIASITLQDDERNSLTTHNPEIIPEMVAFLQKKIEEKIKAIEPLLTW